MGRKKITDKDLELRQKQSKRLSILLTDEQITQAELGNITGYTQQHYSNILGMKSSLSEENADLINQEFPQYRKEWLLGKDDFKTEEDFIKNYMLNKLRDMKSPIVKSILLSPQLYFFTGILKQFGYSIELSDNEITKNNLITIRFKGDEYAVSYDVLNNTLNEIADYLTYKMQKLLSNRKSDKRIGGKNNDY